MELANLHKKFTTALVIDYFNQSNDQLSQAVLRAKIQFGINEALVVLLPFLPAQIEPHLTREERLHLAKTAAYLDREKQYDVWQGHEKANTNEEYLGKVLVELRRQYKHQDQVILIGKGQRFMLNGPLTVDNYTFPLLKLA